MAAPDCESRVVEFARGLVHQVARDLAEQARSWTGVVQALARIPGVDMAREVSVSIYPAEADTGRRGNAVQRLDLPPTSLVYSFEHQVRVGR